jgi:hypothetical protein
MCFPLFNLFSVFEEMLRFPNSCHGSVGQLARAFLQVNGETPPFPSAPFQRSGGLNRRVFRARREAARESAESQLSVEGVNERTVHWHTVKY